MSIWSQYRDTLKHPEVEEFFDLVLFRPIAFPLVKALVHLPVTPNQISVCAMIAGALSGYCYGTGTRTGFLWGALLYAFCNVLDCADGMMARLKGNGTRIGRIVDMGVDIVAHACVFVGLGIGLASSGVDLGYNSWLIVIVAGASYLVHSGMLDHYRTEYMARGLGKMVSPDADVAEMTEELNRYKTIPGAVVQRTLIRVYLWWMRLKWRNRKPQPLVVASRDYADRNRLAVRLWNLIGAASHIVALVVATVLDDMMIFFWFAIVFANVWALLMWIYQQSINRQISTTLIDTNKI